MKTNKTIYLARSGRSDPRIVNAVRHYLLSNDYVVLEYEGGTYNEEKEEEKMRASSSMLVIPENQAEYINYLSSVGIRYDQGCMVGRGVYQQLSYYSNILLRTALMVTDIGIYTCTSEKDYEGIEKTLDVIEVTKLYKFTSGETIKGTTLGVWAKTYALCHFNTQTEKVLDEAYPVRDIGIIPKGEDSSKKINFLLISSLY